MFVSIFANFNLVRYLAISRAEVRARAQAFHGNITVLSHLKQREKGPENSKLIKDSIYKGTGSLLYDLWHEIGSQVNHTTSISDQFLEILQSKDVIGVLAVFSCHQMSKQMEHPQGINKKEIVQLAGWMINMDKHS